MQAVDAAYHMQAAGVQPLPLVEEPMDRCTRWLPSRPRRCLRNVSPTRNLQRRYTIIVFTRILARLRPLRQLMAMLGW